MEDGLRHWKSDDRLYMGDWDSRQATSLALRAILAVNRDDPRIPSILRWLMLKRTGDYTGISEDDFRVARKQVEDIIGLEESYRIERETVEKIYGKKKASRKSPDADA